MKISVLILIILLQTTLILCRDDATSKDGAEKQQEKSAYTKNVHVKTNDAAAKPGRTAHNRIAGGENAKATNFNFIAFINWYFTQSRPVLKILPAATLTTETRIQCMGAILASTWVLSTANCFDPQIFVVGKNDGNGISWHPKEAWVRAGADDAWSDAGWGTQTRIIAKIYVHSAYLHRSTMFDVDVAMLQTSEPFSFSGGWQAKVGRAIFTVGLEKTQLMSCTVIGYGKSSFKQRSTARPLQTYQAVIGSNVYCSYMHSDHLKSTVTYDAFYNCGVADHNSGSTCVGDVGASVVCAGMLTGLVSERRGAGPCDTANRGFEAIVSVGHASVTQFVEFFLGSTAAPTVVQMPESFMLPPLELRTKGRSAESGSAAGATARLFSMWPVVLVAFTASRA